MNQSIMTSHFTPGIIANTEKKLKIASSDDHVKNREHCTLFIGM